MYNIFNVQYSPNWKTEFKLKKKRRFENNHTHGSLTLTSHLLGTPGCAQVQRRRSVELWMQTGTVSSEYMLKLRLLHFTLSNLEWEITMVWFLSCIIEPEVRMLLDSQNQIEFQPIWLQDQTSSCIFLHDCSPWNYWYIIYYLVEWKTYMDAYCSWYPPYDSLSSSLNLIFDYLNANV